MLPPVCEQCGDIAPDDNVPDSRINAHGTKSFPSKWGPRHLCLACRPQDPPAQPKLAWKKQKRRALSMKPSGFMNLKPSEREFYGVTVCVEEQTTHQLRSLVGNGPATKALADVCSRIDALDGEWKVLTVCTPATIFGDLQGYRELGRPMPEETSLGKIGRRDLLTPRNRTSING